jgi:hypothetical protein
LSVDRRTASDCLSNETALGSLGLGFINPLNVKLNPICHLLALGAHHILHVGEIRVIAVAMDKG